jgi:hypothetical protein
MGKTFVSDPQQELVEAIRKCHSSYQKSDWRAGFSVIASAVIELREEGMGIRALEQSAK